MTLCYKDVTVCGGENCLLRNSCLRHKEYIDCLSDKNEEKYPACFVEPRYTTETNECSNYVPA